MIQEGRYLLMNREEFFKWIMELKVNRKVTRIQNHHTYKPDYSMTTSKNHISLIKNMQNYHITFNKMQDIAQHLSTFKDGLIGTGRSFDLDPAGILGFNSGAICIENVGNFDIGGDIMTEEHKKTIAFVTATLALKFNIEVNTQNIVYHHWFMLADGARTNGTVDNPNLVKTCPGTNFFGGNNEPDAANNFIPLVANQNLKFKYPAWQVDCAQFLVDHKFTKSIHKPDEVITFGTFGYMLNNFFDKRTSVDPIAYLKEKGVTKDPHKPNDPMTLATLGYILMNTEQVKGVDPLVYMTERQFITSKHVGSSPLTIWLCGAVLSNLIVRKPFKLNY
jgi:hypothetical protein